MSDHPDNDPVPPAKREQALERDGYQCQYCSAKGTTIGGFATLEIHHKTRDPEGMDVHDLANLVTACRSCHSWHHQQTTDEEVPVELSEGDRSELLPHDLEIVKVLAKMGPASTGEIDAFGGDVLLIAVLPVEVENVFDGSEIAGFVVVSGGIFDVVKVKLVFTGGCDGCAGVGTGAL